MVGRSSNTKYNYKYRNRSISEEKMTVIKPKLEKLVESRKPNIVQLVRKLSEVADDCICSRPPTPIICSGDCSYSFIGRLKMTCPAHPGDQYLMDHSPLCPKCQNSLGKILFSNLSIVNFQVTNFTFHIQLRNQMMSNLNQRNPQTRWTLPRLFVRM